SNLWCWTMKAGSSAGWAKVRAVASKRRSRRSKRRWVSKRRTEMKLYDYFRSSAAYRVRIALHLKGVKVEQIPVHLVRRGAQQKKPTHRAKNPQGLIPALELDDGTVLTQSLAIIDYLDQIFPS